jgi:hypothetical protein
MHKVSRKLALFAPPALVAGLELAHPILTPPIYPKVIAHGSWWLNLHLLNLLLFPLLGLAAYTLLEGVRNGAATLSRIAIAIYVPTYAAMDALAGIGTGILVRNVAQLPPSQGATAELFIDAFWMDGMAPPGITYLIGAVGSVAWVVAMLGAAVALTMPERRKLAATVAVLLFPVGGWARASLFLASDGMSIRPAWWLVTFGLALVMFLVCRPRMPAALLVLAGSLFGALHVPPTGPLGAACFLAAALWVQFGRRSPQGPRADPPG